MSFSFSSRETTKKTASASASASASAPALAPAPAPAAAANNDIKPAGATTLESPRTMAAAQNNCYDSDDQLQRVQQQQHDRPRGPSPSHRPSDAKRRSRPRASSFSFSFSSSSSSVVLPLAVHVLSVGLYLYPLTRTHPYNPNLVSSPRPVLDESHIMSDGNADVRGTSSSSSSWTDVWTNDYWGRPMTSPSSHRSWRPLTVLSFRWYKLRSGMGKVWGWGELFVHRLVNVLIHATVAELVSILSMKLFPYLDPGRTLLLRCLVKLLFAFHPTHVECTANAANRSHIFSLLCTTMASDPDAHILATMVAIAAGLLSSETAVFQLPAVIVTMTAIRWRGLLRGTQQEERLERRQWRKNENRSTLPLGAKVDAARSAALSLVPRYFVVVSLGIAYLGGRYAYDTLSIPDGLIRPAENPYYVLRGAERAATYALVLSIHVGKALFWDWVGFSHEYGFDCVRKVAGWSSPLDDPRLWIPVVWVVLGIVTMCECILAGMEAFVLWAVALSWMMTLFPVSGFVKVGTSIADRIAVPSTVAVAIFGGRLLAWFVADFGAAWFKNRRGGDGDDGGDGGDDEMAEEDEDDVQDKRKKETRSFPSSKRSVTMMTTVTSGGTRGEWTAVKSTCVAALFLVLWLKVDRRASEWMDSVPLLESSLVSCPRSAKSNLEISKIYSGLYPDKFDLEKALSYLRKAEEIDPDYCDLHQQFAHCYIQQGRYLEFEERLTKAVMCPFSMGGAVTMWQRYWQAVTSDPVAGEAAKRRMDKYQKIINEAVQKEVEKEELEKRRKQKESMIDREL